MKRRAGRGFTMVEMLVVMAIVVALIGLLLPALSTARRQAARSRAEAEIGALHQALMQYYTLYSRFPRHHDYGSGGTNPPERLAAGLSVNRALVVMLRGEDEPAGQNPRRVGFMEFPPRAINASGFIDPWDRTYRYMCDFNYDNRVEIGAYTTLVGRSVAVWSTGPSGPDDTRDNIVSWD